MTVFQTPVRLTSIISWNISSVSSHAGAAVAMPALATTMSRRPNSETASATADSIAARSRTSALRLITRRSRSSIMRCGLGEIGVRGAVVLDGLEVAADVERDDVGALLREPYGVATALTACRAGDQSDLALDPSHSVSPLSGRASLHDPA